MTSFQSHHRDTLPNGVRVERLPLGYAAGRWWASFVYSLPEDVLVSPDVWRLIGHSAWVDDPDGLLEGVGGGGGGNEREHQHTWELVDHSADRARVTYLVDRQEVGSELLTLDRADRAGYFSVRLPDGSAVEWLPIGHAQDSWRLTWIRCDVPAAEVGADEDEDDVTVSGERFVRLRTSAGPLGRLGAWGVSGGAVQPFGVALPDTLTHLEVDYLFDGNVVATEVLPPPADGPEPRGPAAARLLRQADEGCAHAPVARPLLRYCRRSTTGAADVSMVNPERDAPMWLYVLLIVLAVLLALWVRRTNLYRHFRSRKDPGQGGYGHSGGHYEGPTGDHGRSAGGGGFGG